MTTTTPTATVTSINITDTGIYAEATCGKVSASISINDYGVRVLCHNASHKVWRGSGRGFDSISDALGAYKKPEMKAMIEAVNRRDS